MKFFTLSLFLVTGAVQAALFIPMDANQRDHLKAYGLVYEALKQGQKAEILLNYRGGSFVINDTEANRRSAALRGISIEPYTTALVNDFESKKKTGNYNSLKLEKAPRIAIYKPPTSEPWDDAVTMVLEYSDIPYDQIWDPEVLKGGLKKYDWLHLHHEDFTGQYGKFYAFARNMEWYQSRRITFEKMAAAHGFSSVAAQKLTIARSIQSYVAGGGFLFAMCSATDTIDIALSAAGIDIIDPAIDQTPITPGFNSKLDYTNSFAFENFEVYTDPNVYEFSDIDVNPQKEGIIRTQDFFTLFEFNSHLDPVPSLLTQNHERMIEGFLGQTTAFQLDKIKSRVLILGQTLGTERVKYIYGSYRKGFFSFYGGHDPEDYQHLVGDPPTNLSLHRNSPGYRLILNNIFLPAAQKKKKKT